MVMKPAKQTPLSMLALAQILEEAGLPGGVLNVVTASSSGSIMGPLIKDPRARKLTFTGSTEVGRKLIEQSAEQVLKVSMELGGNAPFLVFDDADVDDAVEGALIAKMRNIGEACTAANRFHVAELGRRRVRREARGADGRDEGRPRHRGRRRRRPADRRRPARRSSPSWSRTRSRRARRSLVGGTKVDGRRLLLRADRPDRRPRRREAAEGGDLRPGRAGQGLRPTRTRRSPPRTTPSTAWSPTSTRATSSARCACARGSRPEWSA